MEKYIRGDKVRIRKGVRWRPANKNRGVDIGLPLQISAIVARGGSLLFTVDDNPHLYEDETFKVLEVMPVVDDSISLDDESGLDEDFINALLEE